LTLVNFFLVAACWLITGKQLCSASGFLQWTNPRGDQKQAWEYRAEFGGRHQFHKLWESTEPKCSWLWCASNIWQLDNAGNGVSVKRGMWLLHSCHDYV